MPSVNKTTSKAYKDALKYTSKQKNDVSSTIDEVHTRSSPSFSNIKKRTVDVDVDEKHSIVPGELQRRLITSDAHLEDGIANSSVCSSPYQHNSSYRDYSRMHIDEGNDLSSLMTVPALGKDPFPMKLHRILYNEEFRDIISWLPHGRSWRIINPKAFEEKVIPQYFSHSRYDSFMRQVTGWGFRRVSRGINLDSYYHEMFLRGLPHLCLKMRRPGKKLSSLDSEAVPDFNRISESFPLPEYSRSEKFEPSNKTIMDATSKTKRILPEEHNLRYIEKLCDKKNSFEDYNTEFVQHEGYAAATMSQSITTNPATRHTLVCHPVQKTDSRLKCCLNAMFTSGKYFDGSQQYWFENSPKPSSCSVTASQ